MTYGPTGENVTQEVWEKRRIGIWFGAWMPSDLTATASLTPRETAKALSKLPAQRKLGSPIKSTYVDVIRRFKAIEADDWVFTYFDQTLHLAQVASDILPQDIAEFERGGEPFKVRKIRNFKSFELDLLPESFRLLSSAGRGTLHQVGATRVLIQMLADSKDPKEVLRFYRKLDWRDWLDALGPKGWETLCLGYLIQEKDFVPTGIGVGGTLANFDIVGRDRSGTRILAQCKKTPTKHIVDSNERAAYRQSKHSSVYLFAYNGAVGSPTDVTVITGDDIQEWFHKKSAGRAYLKLLTS